MGEKEGLRVERGPGWVRVTGSGSFTSSGFKIILQGGTIEVKQKPTEADDLEADLAASQLLQRRRYERLRGLMEIDSDEPFEVRDLERFD